MSDMNFLEKILSGDMKARQSLEHCSRNTSHRILQLRILEHSETLSSRTIRSVLELAVALRSISCLCRWHLSWVFSVLAVTKERVDPSDLLALARTKKNGSPVTSSMNLHSVCHKSYLSCWGCKLSSFNASFGLVWSATHSFANHLCCVGDRKSVV